MEAVTTKISILSVMFCSIFSLNLVTDQNSKSKFPFDVKFKKYINLPDSLRSKSFVSGLAVVMINLSDKGVVKGFNIMKLSVKNSDNKSLEFYQVNRKIQKTGWYPSNVKRYYPCLYNYVHDLKILRKKGVITTQKEDIFFSVLVRFI